VPRLCENALERRMRKIVFSITFFRQKLPVHLVSASTKSRRKFYTQVGPLSFHTAWVKNGRDALEMGCLHYPRKQTSVSYDPDCNVSGAGVSFDNVAAHDAFDRVGAADAELAAARLICSPLSPNWGTDIRSGARLCTSIRPASTAGAPSIIADPVGGRKNGPVMTGRPSFPKPKRYG
jgi:hypothetical protein